jgi:hypothetical protein
MVILQTLLPCHSDQRGGILRLLSLFQTLFTLFNNCQRQRFLGYARNDKVKSIQNDIGVGGRVRIVILSGTQWSRRIPSVYSGLRLWDPSSYRRHTVPYCAQDDTWESFFRHSTPCPSNRSFLVLPTAPTLSFQALLPCHSDILFLVLSF